MELPIHSGDPVWATPSVWAWLWALFLFAPEVQKSARFPAVTVFVWQAWPLPVVLAVEVWKPLLYRGLL